MVLVLVNLTAIGDEVLEHKVQSDQSRSKVIFVPKRVWRLIPSTERQERSQNGIVPIDKEPVQRGRRRRGQNGQQTLERALNAHIVGNQRVDRQDMLKRHGINGQLPNHQI